MKKIKLTQNKVALVDDNFYNEINKYKWQARWNGYNWYAVRIDKINGVRTTVYMHRFIYELVTNKKLLPNTQIDHKNNLNADSSLDNQFDNLRIVNNKQNQLNSNIRNNSTTKYRGTYLRKNKNRIISQITRNRELKYLGCFPNTQEGQILAALHYDYEALQNDDWEYVRLNFPTEHLQMCAMVYHLVEQKQYDCFFANMIT